MTPATSGLTCGGCFAIYNRASSSWNKSQASLFTLGDSDVFSESWPKTGMMQSGACYRLPKLEHYTSAKDSGYLPTPTGPAGSNTHLRAKGMTFLDAYRMWPTPRAGKVTDENEETWRIRQEAGGVSTPPLSLAVKMRMATPQARDYRTGQAERWANPARSRNLNDQMDGKLSVIFVEWLMGWPQGWTDCGCLATDGCRSVQSQPSEN